MSNICAGQDFTRVCTNSTLRNRHAYQRNEVGPGGFICSRHEDNCLKKSSESCRMCQKSDALTENSRAERPQVGEPEVERKSSPRLSSSQSVLSLGHYHLTDSREVAGHEAIVIDTAGYSFTVFVGAIPMPRGRSCKVSPSRFVTQVH